MEPSRFIPAVVTAGDKQALLESQRPILTALARLDDDALVIAAGATPPAQALTPVSYTHLTLPTSDLV